MHHQLLLIIVIDFFMYPRCHLLYAINFSGLIISLFQLFLKAFLMFAIFNNTS